MLTGFRTWRTRSCGASARHFSYGFPAYCRSLPPQLPLWFSPVLYQSRTLRYCCDRSMNYLYHLSQAVARLGAHGGPKREAAIRTAGVPDSSVRRQRLSALRGPLTLMTDAVSVVFVRLLGAAPPPLSGERLLQQVDFLSAHARQRAVSRQREGVADDCSLGVDLYLGDDCAQ